MSQCSVVVLARDCEASIVSCLDSILAQEQLKNAEIICVSNGSKDGSLTAVNGYVVRKDDLVVLDGPRISNKEAIDRGVDRATNDTVLVVSGCESLSNAETERAEKAWRSGKRIYCTRQARAAERDVKHQVKRFARRIADRCRH